MNVLPSPNVGSYANILAGVSALASNDVWAVGYYTRTGFLRTLVEHWDGSSWSVVPSPNASNGNNLLHAVSAWASNDVWAVGHYYNGTLDQTLVAHWDGSAWSAEPGPNLGSHANNYLNGVLALASNDYWAVGYYSDTSVAQTLVMHWNGSSWTLTSPNVGGSNNELNGVSALSNSDVWAVGFYDSNGNRQTLVEHWNGSAWSVVTSPNPGIAPLLNGVLDLASNNVWAVGDYYNSSGILQTLVEHWNGSAWSVVSSPNVGSGHNYLDGVSALASNDIWAVGSYFNASDVQQTLIEHWNGSAWSVVPSPNAGSHDNALNGVATLPGGDVWAVGYHGNPAQTLVEMYDGTCGTPTPTPTPANCMLSFSDVHQADYFYTPVLYLACHGVISGYSDGTFRPYANTTRSQMVKIVVLGFNKAIVTPSGSSYSFSDVPRTNPFFPVVETAYADGIVSGYTCGVAPAGPCDSLHRPWFLPYANVTRGQLSKIDVIAAGWTLYNPTVPTFTDVARGSTFYQVVETAVCHGVISGYADHTFRPYNDAIRGQISKIVYLSIVNPPTSCGP